MGEIDTEGTGKIRLEAFYTYVYEGRLNTLQGTWYAETEANL